MHEGASAGDTAHWLCGQRGAGDGEKHRIRHAHTGGAKRCLQGQYFDMWIRRCVRLGISANLLAMREGASAGGTAHSLQAQRGVGGRQAHRIWLVQAGGVGDCLQRKSASACGYAGA